MLNKRNKDGGFSLAELLVAMFFVSVAIPALLFSISRTMGDIESSTLRLRAIYLAQEGIEIVRNIRDTNWLGGATSTALEDIGSGGDYGADYDDAVLTNLPCSPFCQPSQLDFLKINSNGFYQYSSGVKTLFKRKITIDKAEDLDLDGHIDRIRVTVEVYWTKRGDHQVKAQEYLYNRWGY